MAIAGVDEDGMFYFRNKRTIDGIRQVPGRNNGSLRIFTQLPVSLHGDISTQTTIICPRLMLDPSGSRAAMS